MNIRYLTFCVCSLLVISTGCSQKEQPEAQATIQEFYESKEADKVSVFVEVDTDALSKLSQGDSLPIELSDGSSYTLQINRIGETMPGIISISAYVNDRDTGQATLILQDGMLNGRVQMFNEKMTYTLGFEEYTNKHFIAPVDPEEKDVIQGSEPLEIPKSNG